MKDGEGHGARRQYFERRTITRRCKDLSGTKPRKVTPQSGAPYPYLVAVWPGSLLVEVVVCWGVSADTLQGACTVHSREGPAPNRMTIEERQALFARLRDVPRVAWTTEDDANYRRWLRDAVFADGSSLTMAEQAELALFTDADRMDVKLAAWMLAGDRDRREVEAWIRGFTRRCIALAMQCGHPFQDAEDFAQQLWARKGIWNGFGNYLPGEGRLVSYYLTIFHNLLKDIGKTRADQRRAEWPIDQAPDGDAFGSPGPEKELLFQEMQQEKKQLLQQGLAELSSADRELLIARFFKGLSYKELADQVAVAEGTLRKRQHDALIRLRSYVVGTGRQP